MYFSTWKNKSGHTCPCLASWWCQDEWDRCREGQKGSWFSSCQPPTEVLHRDWLWGPPRCWRSSCGRPIQRRSPCKIPSRWERRWQKQGSLNTASEVVAVFCRSEGSSGFARGSQEELCTFWPRCGKEWNERSWTWVELFCIVGNLLLCLGQHCTLRACITKYHTGCLEMTTKEAAFC